MTATAPARPATVCLLALGQSAESFRHSLHCIVDEAPAGSIELRVGLQGEERNLHYALGLLCPDGAAPAWHQLPGGVERFHWTGAGGSVIRVWNSSARLSRDRLLRLLFHDVPLESEYAVCLDARVGVEAGWWETQAPLLEQRGDLIGRPEWHEYSPRELERLATYPWYMGVPFEQRDGKPGVSFMTGGVVAVRAERLREADFPREGAGGDVLLGEIARQLGWRRAEILSKKV